jgi:hypothetical protein
MASDGVTRTCNAQAECRRCTVDRGASPRFVDNTDGTLTDRATCLVWEKKTGTLAASPNICQGTGPGSSCDATIHDVNNQYPLSPGGALDVAGFLRILNAQSFAGHTDWRLPTSAGTTASPTGSPGELESILLAPYNCRTSPCIDPAFGPTGAVGYVSGSPVDADSTWLVNFDNGYVYAGSNAFYHYYNARAVRGGP